MRWSIVTTPDRHPSITSIATGCAKPTRRATLGSTRWCARARSFSSSGPSALGRGVLRSIGTSGYHTVLIPGVACLKNESWLAIDTATEVASVAAGSAQHVAAVRSMRGVRQHAAQIVPLIQQVLALAHLRLDQTKGIIVSDGPASFTGLRTRAPPPNAQLPTPHLP